MCVYVCVYIYIYIYVYIYIHTHVHITIKLINFSAQFYYDVITNKYEDKAKLLYTDTDSFIFHIETYDLYNDFKDIDTHMDFKRINFSAAEDAEKRRPAPQRVSGHMCISISISMCIYIYI